jgi:lipoate-protein ligase A
VLSRGVRWRLVDTGALDGASNMAIDAALLETFDPRASAPVLRLYGWSPPALSLGRFQDAASVLDLPLCRERGVPVVRRITGGGVIYHAEELTYSIVCPIRPFSGAMEGVDGSYRRLNGFLLAFYRSLGLDPVFAGDATPPGASPPGGRAAFCFAGRERCDILVDGRKIGGNAQRRTRHALFQHGSIPLADGVAEGVRFLREAPAGLEGMVADLETLGVSLPAEELKNRLAAAFEDAFGAHLAPSGLTAEERERADFLRRQPPR